MIKTIDQSKLGPFIGIIPNCVQIYSFNYDTKETICNLCYQDEEGNISIIARGIVYIYAGDNKNAPFTLSSSDIVNLRDNQ